MNKRWLPVLPFTTVRCARSPPIASVMLGHQSIRVTERHYNPWVHARQQQLEADLERAWARDPMYFQEERVTRGLRGNPEAVNWFNIEGKNWYPGGDSNPHEEKSPEDFKSSASAIPPPGRHETTIYSFNLLVNGHHADANRYRDRCSTSCRTC
jgi:hypothetical protein